MKIINEMDVKSIAAYEECTGHKWPFSEDAFESLRYYYEAESRALKVYNGADPMRFWKSYDNVQEFVDAVIAPLVGKKGPMSNYVKLTIPEDQQEKWEFIQSCIEMYEEEGGGTVITYDYSSKFLVL